MKKTLVALAALSATAGAFAQSSVTLYGILPGGHPNCPTYGHPNCSTWPG